LDRGPMAKLLYRGLAHLVVGGMCAAFIYLLPHWLAIVLLAGGTVFFLLLDLLRFKRVKITPVSWVFRPFLRDSEQRTVSGAFYFLAGCLITAALFSRQLAGAAVLFLTFGDAAACLVGSWKGRIKLWGKSLEGSLACLLACAIAAAVVYLLQAEIKPLALGLGVIAATVLEALPWVLNDNLALPVGSAAVMLAVQKLIS
jgi:acyl phosphate:glycerol-3-phosphate acyltransferase